MYIYIYIYIYIYTYCCDRHTQNVVVCPGSQRMRGRDGLPYPSPASVRMPDYSQVEMQRA